MSEPWRKTDRYDTDDPCLHALVLGTSFYRHLPQGPSDTDNVQDRTFGLRQITTPASSSLRFARWMENEFNNPDAPLGSIRLLLSPSGEERSQEPALADPESTVLPCTARNLKSALMAWKEDCERHVDNIAVLYAAGHGFQVSRDDAVVLLEDFGDPAEPNILAGAVDVGSVWRAMSNPQAAKTQFYFVDACRIKPEAFRKYLRTPVGVTLDETDARAAESAPIFFSAAPGTYALGEPGRGTLFCSVLLECLALNAVAPPAGGNSWCVTTSSLLAQLPHRVEELASKEGEMQRPVVGGHMSNAVFHVLRRPPEVPLHISLKPNEASSHARARLQEGSSQEVLFEDAEFAPALECKVPGGTYVLAVKFTAQGTAYREKPAVPIVAWPPECRQEIQV